jgi:hypothetical protein
VRPEGLGKFNKKSPHRVSKPRPSGLYHSALTTTIPRVLNLDYNVQVNKEDTGLYRVRKANFLFYMEFYIQKRKLACRTLYYVALIFSRG